MRGSVCAVTATRTCSDRCRPEHRVICRTLGVRPHLLIYCLVNAVVLVVWAMTSHGFFWPVFVLAGWGIGLVANFYEAYVRDDPSEVQVAAEIERLRRR